MSAVYLAYAGLSVALGLVRPGLIMALCYFGYIYESYFGPQIIGTAFGALPIGYALFYAFAKKSFRFHAYDAAFVVFILFYIVGTMRSPDIMQAAMYSAKFGMFAVAPYFCIRCFITNEKEFDQFVRDFAISMILLTILFGIVSKPNPWGYDYTIGSAHAVAWSLCMNACLSFLFAYLFFKKDWRLSRFVTLDLVLTLTALALVCYFAYLNGKRGGTTSPVMAAVAVGVFLAMVKARPMARFALVALALLVAASMPLLMQGLVSILDAIPDTVIRGDYKSPFYVVAQLFGAKAPGVSYDPSSQERMAIYSQAFAMIKKSPIFGNGVYSLQLLGLGYSHSIMLEPWVEGGIFMLLNFLVFSGMMFWSAFRYVVVGRCRLTMALVLTATTGCYVQMLTALTLYEGKMLWMGFGMIMAGTLIHLERGHAPESAAPAEASPALRAGAPAIQSG